MGGGLLSARDDLSGFFKYELHITDQCWVSEATSEVLKFQLWFVIGQLNIP